jgi:GDP-4-dehydro-6-deoxy-D-mannose reductase
MANSTIVITGGGGFVGRWLLKELQIAHPERSVVVWDQQIANLPAGVEGIAVDITRPETYRDSLRQTQPQWIVHLAAIVAVPVALKDPALTHRVNVEGTRQLLEAIEATTPQTQMLVTSSSDIYGQGSETPLPELPLAEAQPTNPYAQSKWDMEKIIEADFNDRVIRVRPFNHIGPGQAIPAATASFASQIAAIEQGKQEPILTVGNLEAKRDFTDVRDVVRAYRLLLEKGKVGEVYHVASGKAVSIQTILDQLLALSSARITVQPDPERMRPSDTSVVVGDASKLKKATGWQPEYSLETTLRDILEYWRQQ